MFLADGTPGGVITAEIMNWTGHVTAAPRSRLGDLLKRPELARTGIYILTGDDPENVGRGIAYIGESDNVGRRLTQHARTEEAGGKDFWSRALVITSKDANLTKGHVRFLESRLLTLATESARMGLANGTSPEPCSLPEADTADMEFFIEQVRIILPVLGIDLLRERPQVTEAATDQAAPRRVSPRFELSSRRHDLHAEAQEIDGEFVVLAGSQARKQWVGAGQSYKNLHQALADDGSLVPRDSSNHLAFAADTTFKSPSAASAVVLGRQDNGRKSWVVVGIGQTYAEWQESQIPDVLGEETTS